MGKHLACGSYRKKSQNSDFETFLNNVLNHYLIRSKTPTSVIGSLQFTRNDSWNIRAGVTVCDVSSKNIDYKYWANFGINRKLIKQVRNKNALRKKEQKAEVKEAQEQLKGLKKQEA